MGDVSSTYGTGAYGADTYGYSYTVIRPAGVFEYVAGSNTKVLVATKPAPAAQERSGASTVRAQVPVRPMAAVGNRGGYAGITVTGSQPQPVQFYGVMSRTGTARVQAQTALRVLSIPSDRRGAVSIRSATSFFTQARAEFQGRSTARAVFKFRSSARFELAGRASISYAWSDLTVPGRDPLPNWQAVDGPVPDPWQLVPDLPPN